jgi:hypothetical protein
MIVINGRKRHPPATWLPIVGAIPQREERDEDRAAAIKVAYCNSCRLGLPCDNHRKHA